MLGASSTWRFLGGLRCKSLTVSLDARDAEMATASLVSGAGGSLCALQALDVLQRSLTDDQCAALVRWCPALLELTIERSPLGPGTWLSALPCPERLQSLCISVADEAAALAYAANASTCRGLRQLRFHFRAAETVDAATILRPLWPACPLLRSVELPTSPSDFMFGVDGDARKPIRFVDDAGRVAIWRLCGAGTIVTYERDFGTNER
mmetsp:Transcript_24149/g.74756  ORF Transcript_24149/g.74756 Transcript_24149/m.74756 type:complete len:208 (+) Transcript_24149:796-1419(+)